jgi:hypothetical protein
MQALWYAPLTTTFAVFVLDLIRRELHRRTS